MTSEPPKDIPLDTRLVVVILDGNSIVRGVPEIEHFRESAIYDLVEYNHFILTGKQHGPYSLMIMKEPDRLVLHVGDENRNHLRTVILSMRSLRPIMKDYTILCDSYYEAIKVASAANIEAIDMGRRGLHNEGAQILKNRLEGKIDMDLETARRLFALICSIYRKGRC